jgi:sugar transferase (PEP-CTERM system associated)
MAIRIFSYYVPFRMVILALVEFLLLAAAAYLGGLVRFEADPVALVRNYPLIISQSVLFALVMFLGIFSMGLYQGHMRLSLRSCAIRLSVGLTMGAVVLAVVYYVLPPLTLGRGMLAASVLLALGLLVASRTVFRNSVGEEAFRRRVIVLGAGRKAAELAALEHSDEGLNFRILGFVPAPGDEPVVESARFMDAQGSLAEFMRRHEADEIVVAMDERRQGLPMRALLECRLKGFSVVDALVFMERETGKVRLDMLHPSWFIFSEGFSRSYVRVSLRRFFDVVAAVIMLVLTAPLMLVAALAIWLESGFRGPVLFEQLRVGLDGHPFLLKKFRSMVPNAEAVTGPTWCGQDDPRITCVGRVLRKFRIDELPQLFNVIMGEMSFVGPRPERPEFVDELGRQIPFYSERHVVKPGITGWAQLRYPYGASAEDAREKLQYDLYYAKNQSLLFDFAILLQTAEVVLWGKGVR